MTQTATITDRLDFRVKTPQMFDHTPWRSEPRECVYLGDCLLCRTRVYAFTDGQNDPRGPLGRHSGSVMLPEDYGYPLATAEILTCFDCENDYDKYQRLMRRAEGIWKAQSNF